MHLVFIAVLLCAGQRALGQEFDCNTEAGQSAFLQNGARTDPDCYNPIIQLVQFGRLPTVAQIMDICNPENKCATAIVDFLRGTEECRNNATVQYRANFVENQLCAYKDSNAATSCALEDSYYEVGNVSLSCSLWWVQPGNGCPNPPPLVTPTPKPCTDALKAAIEEYGCCYRALFSSEEFIRGTTQEFIANLEALNIPVPDDFEVDVTDPALFADCDVSLTRMCTSQLTASARSLAVTPLVALLFAIIAKLFA